MDSGRWRAPVAQGPVRASLRLPGSKSITNRALLLAALSESPSMVRGLLKARDTSLAIGALRALGYAVHEHGADVQVHPGVPAPGSEVRVDVGNAGTVMRFLPAVAALTPAAVAFDGDPRARERPVGALLAALRALGVSIDDGGRGALPFTVHGTGSVPGGPVTLDASGSSQLVSGLLLAAPRFEAGVAVRHSGPPVPSLPHIEMTMRMLRDAGAPVEADSSDGNRPDFWRVAPGRLNLGDFTVEPDLSNAGPFLAAALVTGGSVTIRDWPADSLQAAGPILEVITRMGGSVSRSDAGLTVTGSGSVNGIDADLRDIPELCLPLTSVAALASGPSRFTGVGHTRAQETDRLAAIAKEINALGGDVTELPDGLSVRPRPLKAPAGHGFQSYDDHRMVMAAAVLGLGVPGIEVLNVATVGKTFPDFTTLWEATVHGEDHLRMPSAYLDEDDIRVRAGRGSKPRTRRRPAHESAPGAFVVSVDRGRYGCVLDEPGGTGHGGAEAGDGQLVTAMKARELGRGSVVVGDRVALAGDTSGAPGTLARIVRVEERTSVLRRSPDDTDPLERIVVANADRMVIVSALADPAPKTRFIDRCLVAAYDAGLDPLLVLTKSDLAAPRRLRAFYRPLGITMLTTRQPLHGQTLTRLRKALDGRISVLIGQSGVGKSSLVNALVPDAGRAVGRVNAVTGKGRHTSSSAIALPLPGDSGWLIDTPGVRGFGLGHVTVDRVVEAFGDLAEGTEACPPGCDHLSEGCALDAWAAAHDALPRLDSLRRLLASRESAD